MNILINIDGSNIIKIEVSKNKIGKESNFDWKVEDYLLKAAKEIFSNNVANNKGINATIILSLTSAIEGLIYKTAITKGISKEKVYNHTYTLKKAMSDIFPSKYQPIPSHPPYFINFFNSENELNIPINILFVFRNQIAHGKSVEYLNELYMSQKGFENKTEVRKGNINNKTYKKVMEYLESKNLCLDIFDKSVISHFIEKTEEFLNVFQEYTQHKTY